MQSAERVLEIDERRRVAGIGAHRGWWLKVFMQPDDGPSLSSAKLVESGVGRHPVRPSAELGPAVKARQPPHDAHQRFLGGVKTVGVVAGDASAHGIDLILMTAQQDLHRPAVAGLRGGYQVMIVGARPDRGTARSKPLEA